MREDARTRVVPRVGAWIETLNLRFARGARPTGLALHEHATINGGKKTRLLSRSDQKLYIAYENCFEFFGLMDCGSQIRYAVSSAVLRAGKRSHGNG